MCNKKVKVDGKSFCAYICDMVVDPSHLPDLVSQIHGPLQDQVKSIGTFEILLSVYIMSIIPFVIWMVTGIFLFVVGKLTKFQKVPNVEECAIILDNYLCNNDDALLPRPNRFPKVTCRAPEQDSFFWHNQELESSSSSSSSYQTNTNQEGDTVISGFSCRDWRYHHYSKEKKKKKEASRSSHIPFDFSTERHRDRSATLQDQSMIDRRIHLYKAFGYAPLVGDEAEKEEKENDHHQQTGGGGGGRCCYRFKKSLRFLRGNFVMLLLAWVQLLSFTSMMSLALYAINTEPSNILALSGLAWSFFLYQGGLADLMKQYLYYFILLINDKIHVGTLCRLDGRTKGVTCIVKITPLCVVVMVKQFYEPQFIPSSSSSSTATTKRVYGRAEEISFIYVPNYDFYMYHMIVPFEWRNYCGYMTFPSHGPPASVPPPSSSGMPGSFMATTTKT